MLYLFEMRRTKGNVACAVTRMPRKHLIRSATLPYHVTARTNKGAPFPLPMEEMWEITTSELRLSTVLHEIEIQAYMLMRNHFHLVTTTPLENLDKAMHLFMKTVSRTVNRRIGQTGHLWGGQHFRCVIDSELYFRHTMKYVYRNPVKAGICEKVEDYPFSTLHGLIGESHLPFPLFQPRAGSGIHLVPEQHQELLDWLNRPYSKETEESIRRALRRSTFELPRDPKSLRLNRLLRGDE